MQCRICFEEDGILVSPCNCKGTAAYIHPHCLERYFEYYPDRVCRVCRYEIKAEQEVFKILIAYLYLNTLVLVSSCQPMVKVSFVFVLAVVFGYYWINRLFTNTPLFFVVCLSLLFLPKGNESATLGILGILTLVSFLPIVCMIPIRFLFLISLNLLITIYAGTLTYGVYSEVDTFAFAVYICVLYLIWYPWTQHLRLQLE